ncbi:MAG: hypothetical protein IKM88_05370, partial [Lachnospiraceae bacterium]|nr:hypothetical protein [Lachnospiraceae bacterium]
MNVIRRIAALKWIAYVFDHTAPQACYVLNLCHEYLTENWIKIFPKKSRPFWQELASDAGTALNN